MKQSVLNFSAAKRTASSNTNSKPKTNQTVTSVQAIGTPDTVPNPTREKETVLVPDSDEDDIETPEELPVEEEEEIESDTRTADKPEEKVVNAPPVGRVTRSSTKAAAATTPKATPKATLKAKSTPKKAANTSEENSAETIKATVFRPSNATPENVAKKVAANEAREENDDEPRTLNDKDPRYNRYAAEVNEKLDWHQPIHAGNQNRIHKLLRVFDNSYEYGPCVGVSRRERWDRAKAMGLNPPPEVDDILNTIEGKTLKEYSQSVFYGEV
ncbi:hypothetical protein D9613_007136 [Agrocybe pediades]|uniref:DNA polymerase delta subunit 4 n=1 Tax=Agrocybe pediades TaxID=84607 RepID=A0A8H4VIQ4_9AGAR|nr:hypothetical protein D9613_007136 [Agrocybe pediades]